MPRGKNINQELKNKVSCHNSKVVHDGNYLFVSDYINSRDKMKIFCSIHGDFEQSYNMHIIKAQGCPKCAGQYSYTTKEAIQNMIGRHNNIYNYHKFIYTGASNKSIISCKIHGDFTQEYSSHMSGKGCPKCAYKYSYTTEEAIDNMNIKHKNKYSYTKFIYIKSKIKGIITCKDHGDFEQSYNNHMKGQICPKCSIRNFDDNQKTELYILKNSEGNFKVGISVDVKSRIIEQQKTINFFNIEYVKGWSFDSFSIAREYESKVHQELKEYNTKFEEKFDGYTEWFSCPLILINNAVINIIGKVS